MVRDPIAHLDDADDDVLQARAIRVVVQHQGAVLGALRAAEGRCPHARIQRAQVVVQCVQVLYSTFKYAMKNTIDHRRIINSALLLTQETSNANLGMWSRLLEGLLHGE